MHSLPYTISLPLPPLSMLYPLTPATTLHLSLSDIPWLEITDRLFGALKRMSIHSSCNPAEASIYCVRGCYDVEFRIRFFADEQDIVIIDICRIRGCNLIFQRDAAAILRELKGLAPRISSHSRPLLLAKQPPISSLQSNEEQLLHRVEELLGKDRLDAQLLGMESLYRLFLSTSRGKETALQHLFAHNVYRSDNSASSKVSARVLEMILSLAATRKLNADDDDDDDGDEESFNPKVGEVNYSFVKFYTAKMHLMALFVLCSLLEVASNTDTASSHYNTWLQGTLLPTILQGILILDQMEPVPMHGAYLLTKCLRLVVQGCQDPVRINLTDVKILLQNSWLSMGARSHALLEEECAMTVDVLNQTC